MRVESRRRSQLAAIVLVCCVLSVATPASAAGGNLVLLPDWTGTLPMLLLLFALLIYPANVMLFKPIFKVLDARDAKTTGTRKRAEKIMADAEATLDNYRRAVREVREEAERDRKAHVTAARSETASLTAAARDAAEREIERATRELKDALEQSRATLRAQADGLAADAAARVLGRPL